MTEKKVHSTRLLRRSISQAFLLAMSFAGTALADTRVEGSVYAPSPCEFLSSSRGEIGCAAVIVPLRTVFELKSGGVTRRIRTDKGGKFSTTLPQGRYRLSLLVVERALPTGGYAAVPLNTITAQLRNLRVPRRTSVSIDLQILKKR